MENAAFRVLHIALMIWGRRWRVLLAAAAICIVGWAVVVMIPSRYQASTRIYVDTDTLLAPLLRGMAVDVNMVQQLDVMQKTLLSRPNLESVLRMSDLDLRANTPQDRDQLVSSLERRVSVRAVGRNLFTVTYVDPDREVARKVVQSLLTIFIESNLGASRQDIQKARRFIDDQIAEYERQLKVMENRMAEFKRQHPGLLAQAGTVATRMETARTRLLQIQSDIEDSQAKRESLAKEMKNTPQYLEVDGVPMVLDRNNDPAATLEKDISAARQRLSQLRLRFTEQHPDIVDAQRFLDGLLEQKRVEAEEATKKPRSGSVAQRVPNPLYDQIRLKLVDAETELRALERRLANQKIELERLEELARVSPEIEAQAIGLDRDYNVIKKNYEELLDRRESAKLSQDVDTKADKIQFRIIDPPFVPNEPNFPNRPLLLTGVLLAALGGGIVFGFVQAQLGDAFSSAQQLFDTLRLNVIGNVSWVRDASPRRQFREVLQFSGAMFSLLLIYGLLMTAMMVPQLSSFITQKAGNLNLGAVSDGLRNALDLLRSAF